MTGVNAVTTAMEERTTADVHFIVNRQIWLKEKLKFMSRAIAIPCYPILLSWDRTILRQREEMLTYDV
jgi:hypothetical protein